MPEATAAAVSKAVWNRGTRRDDCGHGPAMMLQQHAGSTTIVSGPRAFNTRFMAMGAAQPGHAR
jgi:hypothetical protein